MHTFLASTFLNKLIAAFSWMLMHSLWQGLLSAALVAILYASTSNRQAVLRYNLCIFIFSVIPFAAAFTFIWEWNAFDTITTEGVQTAVPLKYFPLLFFAVLQTMRQAQYYCTTWIALHQTIIVSGWTIVCCIKVLKMIAALAYNEQMKYRQVHPAPAYWQEAITRLCAIAKIDKVVVLMESGCMKIPVVIGHLKPVILMPIGLLMSLSPAQAEAILLHELAHIKRNDYVVNLLQHLAETIFFFNPAVWWISACIREERENCCDDITVSKTRNKLALAEALIAFKQYQLNGYVYQTAFPGKKKELLRRVQRIFGNGNKPVLAGGKIWFAAGFIMLFATAFAIAISPTQRTATIPFSTTNIAGPLLVNDTISSPVKSNSTHKKVVSKMIATERKMPVTANKLLIVKGPAGTIAGVQSETVFLTNQQMPLTDMAQAEQDLEQAKNQHAQAIKDQLVAQLDQRTALLDQKLAMLDQAQAIIDQHRAEKDQAAAALQHETRDMNKKRAMQDKKEAELKMHLNIN